MPLTPQQEGWLKEFTELPAPAVALVAELPTSSGVAPERAALARYELSRRASEARDSREARTLAVAKDSALWGKFATIIAAIALIISIWLHK